MPRDTWLKNRYVASLTDDNSVHAGLASAALNHIRMPN